MKNIILQHWTGDMIELTELSSANISKYAKKIGAEYKILRGNVFHPNLTPPCQKIYMLNEEFDEYDTVVMLDADMFTRKGMKENIFTDVEGVGRHTDVQDSLVTGLKKRFPHLGDPRYSYWGGAIYKISREMRLVLRKNIKEDELKQFSGSHGTFQDEGIMHRLAVLSQIKNQYFPDNSWDCGNFEPGIERASIIHIRKKPHINKMLNYKDLVSRGIIEECLHK